MIRALAVAALSAGFLASVPASAATRSFAVGGFTRLTHDAPVEVRVRTGGASTVRAEGPAGTLERLRIEVRDGELVIGTHADWRHGWGRRERTLVYVTVPSLSAARLAGPGKLSIDRVSGPSFAGTLQGPGALDIGQVATRDLRLTLSGPGEINAAGHATRTNIVARGPGGVHADGLISDDLRVELSGIGEVRATARRTANVLHSGIGQVRIGGHPRCTVTKRGIGDVICG